MNTLYLISLILHVIFRVNLTPVRDKRNISIARKDIDSKRNNKNKEGATFLIKVLNELQERTQDFKKGGIVHRKMKLFTPFKNSLLCFLAI